MENIKGSRAATIFKRPHRSRFRALLRVANAELSKRVATPRVHGPIGREGDDVVVAVRNLHDVGSLENVDDIRSQERPELVEVLPELSVVVGSPSHDPCLLLFAEQHHAVVLSTLHCVHDHRLKRKAAESERVAANKQPRSHKRTRERGSAGKSALVRWLA